MKPIQSIGIVMTALTLLTGMSGCSRYPFEAEEKVNAAIPPSANVLKAHLMLEDMLEDGKKKAFQQEWARRQSLRALSCSKGFQPAWYVSQEEVRSKLTDLACFRDQDEDIAGWLGLLRVGIELAKPALRPLPPNTPKLVAGDETLRSASFASEAGVAALMTARNMLLMDLNTGQPLLKDKLLDRGRVQLLSPNGRLLVSSDSSQLIRFHDTESGEEISRLSSSSPNNFLWLGKEHGIFSRRSDAGNKAILVNFQHGRETELPFALVSAVFPVPGAAQEFLLITNKGVAKVELVSRDGNTIVNLLDEQKLRLALNSQQSPVQTADQKYLVGIEYPNLAIVNTETLATEKVDMGPGGYVQAIASTADPDQLVIRTTGIFPSPTGVLAVQDFLYSLSDQTFAPLENPPKGQLTYVPALKTLMALNDDRLVAYEPKLAEGEPLAAQQMAAERRLIQAQRQMDEAERLEKVETEARAAALLLPNLPANVRIEAVGVYQALRRGNSEVRVRVDGGSHPLVLVLSSYEAVRWQLSLAPGAKVVAILVGGDKNSTVNGANGIRIQPLGSQYAYQTDSTKFRTLNDAVVRATGKSITTFQGAYEGTQFAVSR